MRPPSTPAAFRKYFTRNRGEHRRSKRFAKAIGFRREGFSPRYLKIGGHWRDHERWTILADDWNNR